MINFCLSPNEAYEWNKKKCFLCHQLVLKLIVDTFLIRPHLRSIKQRKEVNVSYEELRCNAETPEGLQNIQQLLQYFSRDLAFANL